MKEKGHRSVNPSSRAASERTDGVESDSEDRGRTYGDGDHGTCAAPWQQRGCALKCEHCSQTWQGRRMINIRNEVMLYLTFGRRGKYRGAHSGPIHWTGHSLLRVQRRTFRHREIGQRTDRSHHLAQGEEKEHQENVLRIHSSNHGTNHTQQHPLTSRPSFYQLTRAYQGCSTHPCLVQQWRCQKDRERDLLRTPYDSIRLRKPAAHASNLIARWC